ncbi:MAG: NAD-dependent epimerase/dehydratase family protein [Desulfatirhabdiaceae bacterium]
MKVLLTGASGFVGSHILDSLRARGIATTVLIRPTSNRRFIKKHLSQIEVRLGAINDLPSLCDAMSDVTHVIHCAGCTKALHVAEFYDVNQAGTRHVVEAVNHRRHHIRRLVYISSLAAAGPAPPAKPVHENDPPQPVSEYGKSKLAGEREVREKCRTGYVILRPPVVYGPRDEELLCLFKGVRFGLLPTFGGGRQALSLVFVTDLAETVVTSLTHPGAIGQTLFVASPEMVTAKDLIQQIAAQMNVRTMPIPLPTAILWTVCAIQDVLSRLTGKAHMLSRHKYVELHARAWVCDPSRLRQELGVECATNLMMGIAETMTWYRRQGWL